MARFRITDTFEVPGQAFVLFCASLDKSSISLGDSLRIPTGKGIVKLKLIGIEEIKGKQLGNASDDIGLVIGLDDKAKLEGVELRDLEISSK